MNIISGNCAGTFSGFLAQLAWMETAEKSNGEINLHLHTRNKTEKAGNTYFDYTWRSSNENDFKKILEKNILFDFFEPNEYLSKKFPEDFTYFETYPIEIKQNLLKYPEDTLKYGGRGNLKDQYLDVESLAITRNALNRQWNKFKFTEKFNDLIKEEEKIIKNKKVLTLMLRYSDHYRRMDVLEKSIQMVRKKIDDYDHLLLITLVQPFVDEFEKVFGDKCIFTQRSRVSEDIDWPGGRNEFMPDDEYLVEYQNAFLDVILSSKTDTLIGSSSNMFFAALCMNPKIQHNLFCFVDGR
jgi:hypothetical protein